MSTNIILYGHGGSSNHGCEAIVRSLTKILYKPKSNNIELMSLKHNEDKLYKFDEIISIKDVFTKTIARTWDFWAAYIKLKLFKQYEHLDILPYINTLCPHHSNAIALSIGGDNYCYGDIAVYACLNKMYNKRHIKTAFVGCSVEPESIADSKMLADLNRYSLIIARESITYEAMVKAGLSNVKLLPDPAFQLERVDLELPDGFIEGNTVGINLSPMVMNCENGDNITLKNYEKLIEHIIATSDMQIALIPHVVWAENDDRVPLKMLYEKYKNTGRVVMIEDHNCMELKGYIARCRFMIAARTHASIAAYSTCVPTLVVGYSVKAKGIAKDIFGTYENYVLPVQSLSQEEDLTNAFDWIYQREDQIRTHLQTMMPKYRDRALLIGEELKKIM